MDLNFNHPVKELIWIKAPTKHTAGFELETVELIEAHGTGTKAGDLAEFNGLREIFRHSTRDERHVALGSVKSQIGHTKATAGAAGLMKVALALHQRVLPPTAKITAPNPKMAFDGTPLYLNTEARPWVHAGDTPRRAGVSASRSGGRRALTNRRRVPVRDAASRRALQRSIANSNVRRFLARLGRPGRNSLSSAC